MMPTVLPCSSTPPNWERCHLPSRSARFAGTTFRATASNNATASSAAETILLVGAFTTNTPAPVAAGMSTLSRPTPARAIIFKFGAAAIACASNFVAERTRTAVACANAGSNSSRFAPSQCLISKSSPRTEIVAGDNSSAIRTIGFDITRF